MYVPTAPTPRPDAPSIAAPFRVGVIAALLAFAAGCSGGGFGDPPSKPLADVYGDGERLCKTVLGAATWTDSGNTGSTGCAQPPDHAVYVTGVTVVAVDRFDETGDGAVGNYWVQDLDSQCAGLPYSGVTIYGPSFSPPDLRVATNDVVDLNGSLTEFIGPSSSPFGQCRTLPEISGTMSFRFDGADPPAPVTIDVKDLKSYDTARQWIGMLVKVENVTLTDNGKNSGGRYTAPMDVGGGVVQSDVPKITNELYDIEAEGPALVDATTYKSVTGIVTYFYGFHLVPRSPADFEP